MQIRMQWSVYGAAVLPVPNCGGSPCTWLHDTPNSHSTSTPLIATSPLTWCYCRADLSKGCEQDCLHGMRTSLLSGRKEVRRQLQIGYTCSLHCPPNGLHAITSMHECTPLECVTHGTLSTDKALQLTISKDRRVIGCTWEEDFFCLKEDLQLACILWRVYKLIAVVCTIRIIAPWQ